MKNSTKKQREDGLARIRKDIALGRVEIQGAILTFQRVKSTRGTTQFWLVFPILNKKLNIGQVEWEPEFNAYLFSSNSIYFGFGTYSLKELSEFTEALNLTFHKMCQ